jgi:hypothetical protein
MKISISTKPPATEKRPAIIIDGRRFQPGEVGPGGRLAGDLLRTALYSGQIPKSLWEAAERVVTHKNFMASAAIGGSKKGATKRRGDAAYYSWVTACREARRLGLPRPEKPPAS